MSLKGRPSDQIVFKDPTMQARIDQMPVSAIECESLSYYPMKTRTSRREAQSIVEPKEELLFTALTLTKQQNIPQVSNNVGSSLTTAETRRNEQDVSSEQKRYNALFKEVKLKREELFSLVKANVMPEQQIELLNKKTEFLRSQLDFLSEFQTRLERRYTELGKELNDLVKNIKNIELNTIVEEIDSIRSKFNSPAEGQKEKLMAYCQRIALLEQQLSKGTTRLPSTISSLAQQSIEK